MKSKFPLITHINKRRAKENVRPINLGIQYTEKYREIIRRNATQLKQIFDLPRAESFDRNAIALLLKQKGAESIRIYYGVDENNQVRLILVPVDEKGRDIIVPLLKTRRSDQPTGTTIGQDTSEEDEEDMEDEEDAEKDEAQESASPEMLSEQASSALQGPSALDVHEEAQVVNSGQRCPHVCDDLSVLNGEE